MFLFNTCSTHRPRIDDLDLLEALVKMAASNLSAQIVDAGHQYAMTSSSASLTPSSHLSEVFTGLTQAEFLKKVAIEDMSSVAEKLRIIAAHVFDSSQLRYNQLDLFACCLSSILILQCTLLACAFECCIMFQ